MSESPHPVPPAAAVPREEVTPAHERLGHDRLPPGQRLVTGWPVLHYGGIPRLPAEWRLELGGMVREPRAVDWETLMALPQVTIRTDIHCVTTWSTYDNDWTGVRFRDVMTLVDVLPGAAHVMFHAYGGYTTNVPLADLLEDDVLLAHSHNGEPLTEEHGGPLRGLVPRLYLWKSAKWVRGIEFMPEARPGFWEMYGYHMRGDPWREERYG